MAKQLSESVDVERNLYCNGNKVLFKEIHTPERYRSDVEHRFGHGTRSRNNMKPRGIEITAISPFTASMTVHLEVQVVCSEIWVVPDEGAERGIR